MKYVPLCGGCEKAIYPHEVAAYVMPLDRAEPQGTKPEDPEPDIYHAKHVPGFSRTLWEGNLADWPGPKHKY
jgi:hypothetical protein